MQKTKKENKRINLIIYILAEVAELEDAGDSKSPGAKNPVRVRVPPSAHFQLNNHSIFLIFNAIFFRNL